MRRRAALRAVRARAVDELTLSMRTIASRMTNVMGGARGRAQTGGMTNIDSTRTVAELADTLPGATRVFERLGLDYCCRGRVPLEQACNDANIPLAGALALLTTAAEGRGVPHIPSDANALIQLILDRHHVFTRDELTRLEPLSAKVLRVHRERAPELERVDALLRALRDELLPHMEKENHVLFPMGERLETTLRSA